MDKCLTAMEWACREISRLVQEQFYGTITLSFEKGCIVNLKVTRNAKPPIGRNM
jgi:hypothetical protein